MQHIATWLNLNGLSQYSQAFLDHNISTDLLGDLDNDDLRELGLSLGDRKRFQRAVKEGNDTALAATDGTSTRSPIPDPKAEAERRHLTVAFIDLVGSTALTETLDPEDMSQVVSEFQSEVRRLIDQFGGYISRYMGDSVLAYFGWPKASEDAASRATHAALIIAESVAELRTPNGDRLACRCGIATGLVVVGELIGTGVSQEHVVIGETPNLAARLQALAAPDCTLISNSTRRLLGDQFEFESLGLRQLKGISEEVPVYKVLKTHILESRYHADRHASSRPMIGRETQIAALEQCWQQAKDGTQVWALLRGEAGIGKSRLLHGFIDATGISTATRAILQCDAQHADTPLYSTRQLYIRLAGINSGDNQSLCLQKLKALPGSSGVVESGGTSADRFSLIATLIGLSDTGLDKQLSHLNAGQIKQLTLQAIVDFLCDSSHLAADTTNSPQPPAPLLLVIEDAHWIDPTTLELLQLLTVSESARHTFILVTARPEFQSSQLAPDALVIIPVTRLSEQQCRQIISTVTGDTELPDSVLDEIVKKTDGIPLFTEELTKTVVEFNSVEKPGNSKGNSSGSDLFIPSSLHDSLMARLDKLQPAREVAQTAACHGREFYFDLLLAIVPIDEAQLEAALTILINADLLFRQEQGYSFKHALVRDAAYESLLKSKRQRIHLKIAHVLENQFESLAISQPEIPAYHFRLAGSYSKASEYWHSAATLALQRIANREAISHATSGLECLTSAGEESADSNRKYDLLFARGMGYMAVHGYAADTVTSNFTAAMRIATDLDDRERYSQAARGVITAHIVSSRFQEGLQLAESMLASAITDMHRFYALRMQGQIFLWQARFEESRQSFEEAIKLYDPACQSPLSQWDDGVLCIGFLGITLTSLGHPGQGDKMHRKSVEMAQQLNQPFSYCQAMESWITSILLRGDDYSRQLKKLKELADTHQMVFFQACAEMYEGIQQISDNRAENGVVTAAAGLARYQACQSKLGVPKWMTYVAEGYLRVDQVQKSIDLLNEAQQAMDDMGNEYFRAAWWRVRAESQQVLAPDDTQTELFFKRSIELCQNQGARLFELTSTMSLTKYLIAKGRQEEAFDTLNPIVGSFTHEENFTHLTAAYEILARLSAKFRTNHIGIK
ncbi:hypothetical protein AB833_07550 [Chromatiales bacterium (ex Bugula neritina AB1)]|nr:hypothetical protein AB833_07550 [Chromatiales bacterium (ex Bugula neritina AB1)]